MRTDLNLLRKNQDDLSDLIESLELELVEDPRWDEPSDASYLNAKDRANPSIMANVEAMSATNALIDWFGKDMEGFVGFWRGPGNTPSTPRPSSGSTPKVSTRSSRAPSATTSSSPPTTTSSTRTARPSSRPASRSPTRSTRSGAPSTRAKSRTSAATISPPPPRTRRRKRRTERRSYLTRSLSRSWADGHRLHHEAFHVPHPRWRLRPRHRAHGPLRSVRDARWKGRGLGPANVWMREVGVLILALAVMVLLVRRAPDSSSLRALFWGNALVHVGLFPIEILAWRAGIITRLEGILPNSVFHVLVATGFVVFATRMRVGTFARAE